MSLLALHVRSDGRIVDSNGTPVYLHGLNTAGTEYGDGIGDLSQARINALASTFSMNLWRLSINVAWWNSNVTLPCNSTAYQTWIGSLITWMKANNCYIIINPTTWFSTSPGTCGAGPSQSVDAGLTQAQVITAIENFYSSFVGIYGNDPAFIWCALNEPFSDITNYDTVANAVINSVRGLTGMSSAIMAVYANGYNVASYAQSNLFFDWHIYDTTTPGNHWNDKLVSFQSSFNNTYTAGYGVAMGEFNLGSGCFWNPIGFGRTAAQLCLTQGAPLCYYSEPNVLQGDNVTLSTEGTYLQAAFASIAKGPRGWYA